MVLPGNPDWLHTLTRPLFVDPHVGVVACSVTQTGIASQHVRAAIAPGYYLTTAFAPIVFAAKVGAMADAITGIPEDMFCDHEVSLNLMEKGYKIVMATQIAQYHEGMQTNLRVYGGDDPTAWIKKAGERIKEEVPQRHPLRWCQRLDACEMTPVEF